MGIASSFKTAMLMFFCEVAGAKSSVRPGGPELKEAERRLAAAERRVNGSADGLRLARRGLADAPALRKADPQTRRRWNQALFKKVYVSKKEGVTSADQSDEIAGLLDEKLEARLKTLP